MSCKDCPYIQAQIDKIFSEQCEGTDAYRKSDEMGAIVEGCFCKKTGGAICQGSQCSDAYSEEPKSRNYSRKKKRNKRERNLRYRRHLKLLVDRSSPYWGSWGAVYIDDIPKPYYRRIYRSDGGKCNRYKYFRKISNEHVRRYEGAIHKGGAYRKIFDYWWSVD